MMLFKNKGFNNSNQAGFAAIVIAIVIIMVLSLMTVGFAQLMQSNQKSALNKQLSSQAYYAAETGVNDAAQAYAAGYNQAKTTCAPLSGLAASDPGNYLSQSVVNSSTGTNITCLLTNPDPSNISIPASDNQPTVVEMQGCSQTNTASPSSQCGNFTPTSIGTISISWNDSTGSASTVSSPNTCTNHLYPRSATSQTDSVWSYQNILRLELVPAAGGNLTRSDLVNDEYTAFLCPDNAASAASDTQHITTNTGLNSGDILDSICTGIGSSNQCTVKFDVSQMNGTTGYSTYFLILRAMYPTNISTNITLTDSSGASLNIGDAQLLVDSTGEAQNVLKRIQVRVPETNIYYMPEADIHGEVCKQLGLLPTAPSTPNNSVDYTPCGQSANSIRSKLQQ